MLISEYGFSMASSFLGNGGTARMGGVEVEGVSLVGGMGSVCVSLVEVVRVGGVISWMLSVCIDWSVVVVSFGSGSSGFQRDDKNVFTLGGRVVLFLRPSRSSVSWSRISCVC